MPGDAAPNLPLHGRGFQLAAGCGIASHLRLDEPRRKPAQAHVLAQDVAHLADGVRVFLNAVVGAHDAFADDTTRSLMSCALRYGTTPSVVLSMPVGRSDPMIEWNLVAAGGGGGCIACNAIRIGESVSSVSMLVGKPPESPRVEGVWVVLDELVEQFMDAVGVGDQVGADAADDAAGQVRTAVRRGEEDDPAHERERLEEEVPAQLIQDRARAEDVFKRAVGVEPPELVAARDGHHAAQDAAHAVAQENHPIEFGVAAVRVIQLLGLDQAIRAGWRRRSGWARRSDTCRAETGTCPGSSGLRRAR